MGNEVKHNAVRSKQGGIIGAIGRNAGETRECILVGRYKAASKVNNRERRRGGFCEEESQGHSSSSPFSPFSPFSPGEKGEKGEKGDLAFLAFHRWFHDLVIW